jgi:DNA-binding XRE family transcriptional regulator
MATTYTDYKELEDEFFGAPGTPLRARYEAALELAAIPAAIRDYRRQHQLTQAELGLRLGVSKAQICKLERNTLNVTIDTLQKVFGALGVAVKIKLEPAE